jgi:hypothetical protein
MASLSLSKDECDQLLSVIQQKHGDEVISAEVYHKFVRLLTQDPLASGVFNQLSDHFSDWPLANLYAETGATLAHFRRNQQG